MRIDSTQLMTIKPELAELIKNLEVGDTLKGRVLEALGNSIAIKTSRGQIFTAALQEGISIPKGAFVELIINNIADGKIFAEFKAEAQTTDMDAKLSELLKQLDLPNEGKNNEAVKLLMKYNLPVSKEAVINITGLKKSIDNLNQTAEGKFALLLSEVNIKNTPVDVLNKIVLGWSPGLIKQDGEDDFSANTVSIDKTNSTKPESSVEKQEEVKLAQGAGKEAKTESTSEAAKKLIIIDKTLDMTEEAKAEKGLSKVPEKPIAVKSESSFEVVEESRGSALLKILDKLGVEQGSEIKRLAVQVTDVLASIKDADMEALTYLASKEMEATPKNIGILMKNIENTDGIAQFLDKLQKQLEVENDTELKDIKEAIRKVFLEPRQLENKEEVAEQLKEITKLGERLENYLESSGNRDTEIRDTLFNLKDNIDFIKNINEYNNYLQLPVVINGDKSTAKLYVFNEGKKGKAINPENATILLALDLKALGHLESMIGIKGKTVNVTFRVENKSVGALLEGNSKILKESLVVKGYNLSPLKIIDLEQPFNLLSMEALINEKGNGKIHFDMRV